MPKLTKSILINACFGVMLAISCFSCTQAHASSILIIGDSISAGYTPYVRRDLPCVEHSLTPGNSRDSGFLLQHIPNWLFKKHYKLMVFNAGLWDIAHLAPTPENRWNLAHSTDGPPTTLPEDYRSNLEKAVQRMRKSGALVIFVTSTDVPGKAPGRRNDDIVAYNHIARAVMEQQHVPVIDAYTFMLAHQDLHQLRRGNPVHYTEIGYKLLAGKIVSELKKLGGSCD